jgi:hypothetical protein
MFRVFTGLLTVLIGVNSLPVLSQTSPPEIFLVPVTSKPSPLLRLQFAYENDSVKLYGTNLTTLPIAIKKTKFANPKIKLNFANSINQAATSLERNYTLQRDTSLGFRTKLTGQSYYTVLKGSFLEGEGNAPIFVNQHIRLGGFPAPATWPQNFTASVSGIGIFTVNYLPAANLVELPVFDSWACEETPGRFYKLRALQGYGLEKITYKPYNARRRETVKKSFDIYFESNSTQAKAAEIKAVTDYLEQNRFEILNAVMEGGSSVEGDQDRNKKLQRDRARVISAALARYNRSAIKKDTILLSDNWPKFREQIKASQQSWLDTLSNEKILNEINSNEKLRKSLEPILKTQRKASLNLTMAKILNADDQFLTLQKSLNSWLKTLLTTKQPSKELEPQIMGAIAYLFEQHANNELNGEEVDSLLLGDYMANKYVYLGLHIIKQFTDNKFGPEEKNTWGEKWSSLELETWFSRAQESLVQLADNATKPDLNKYLKMQADFQAFSYRLINLGILNINFLCKERYPDKPEYMGLTLNQYAFLYEMANERAITSDCVSDRKTLTGRSSMQRQAKLDSATSKSDSTVIVVATPEAVQLSIEGELPRTWFKDREYKKPSYDNSPKGAYYFMLKQGFVKGKNILGSVDGNLSLDAFSLYHLLDVNVTNWKPEENSYYDKEIRLEEMDRLITSLKKSSSICAPLVNTLYLTYHSKALRYLELYFEPGSAKHKDIADGSMKFIVEYYKKRMTELKGDVPLQVALYLNQFNWFPGTNEGTWYGFDLINSMAKKRKLNENEMKLWANYLKVYDRELQNPLPVGYSKENLTALMQDQY